MRDAMALDQLRAFRRLERIRISDDPHPVDERKPKRDRAAKAVEKWQRSEDQILPRRVEHDAKLRDVANEIAVTQDDAFGIARAAAGEKQNRFGVVPFPRNSEQPDEPAAPAGQIAAIHQRKILAFIPGSNSSSCTTSPARENPSGVWRKRSPRWRSSSRQSPARARSASRPLVKFKPTGTLPASTTARFATTPPLLAGRTMPIRLLGKFRAADAAQGRRRAEQFAAAERDSSIPSITAIAKRMPRQPAHRGCAEMPAQAPAGGCSNARRA